MKYSIKTILLFVVLISFLALIISLKFRLSNAEKRLTTYTEVYGVNGESEGFEVLMIGRTFQTENSTELAGGHLIRVSNPDKYDLELNYVDGACEKEKTVLISFLEPEIAITINRLNSEINDLPTERLVVVDRTDLNWLGPSLINFRFDYQPHFVFSYKIEQGNLHNGSILTFFFYSTPGLPFKYELIQDHSPEKLKKLAIEHKIDCIFFRLVPRAGKT